MKARDAAPIDEPRSRCCGVVVASFFLCVVIMILFFLLFVEIQGSSLLSDDAECSSAPCYGKMLRPSLMIFLISTSEQT